MLRVHFHTQCTYCGAGERDIQFFQHSGDVTCTQCGTVLQERSICIEEEGRSFEGDPYFSRCETVEDSRHWRQTGAQSEIGGMTFSPSARGGKNSEILSVLGKRSIADSKEVRVSKKWSEWERRIHDVTRMLGFSTAVATEALMCLAQLEEKRVVKHGRVRWEFVAALINTVCLRDSVPIILPQLLRACEGAKIAPVQRATLEFQKAMNLDTKSQLPKVEDVAPAYYRLVGLSPEGAQFVDEHTAACRKSLPNIFAEFSTPILVAAMIASANSLRGCPFSIASTTVCARCYNLSLNAVDSLAKIVTESRKSS